MLNLLSPMRKPALPLLGALLVVVTCGTVQAALVAYYDFDGNVDDQSGSGNDGTLVGSAGYSTDHPAQTAGSGSLTTSSANSGVMVASPVGLDATTFTLSYWMNNPGQVGAWNRVTSRSGDTFETAVKDTGALAYYAPAAGWNTLSAAPSTDMWHHVVWTQEPNNPIGSLKVYVDGQRVDARNATINPSGNLAISLRHNSTESFLGNMDDVALWNERLTAGRIADLAEGLVSPLTMVIPITNPSFEADVIGDNVSGSATGWSGTGGVFNPIDSQFPGASDQNPDTNTSIPDGSNLAYSNDAGTALTQTLSSVLADGHYLLRVEVGDRLDLNMGDYDVQLWAGSILLTPATSLLPDPPDGQFATASLVFDIPTGHAGLGQPLEIRLLNNGGIQAVWDDVRLYYGVPEPSTLGLFLSAGLTSLLAFARRRRRRT